MAHDEAAHDGVIGDDLPSPTDVDWSHSGAGTAHAKRNEHVSSSKMRNDGDEDLSREATSSDSYGIDTVGAPGYNTDITQLVRDLISQIDGLEDRVARLETHCGLGPAACGTATSMGKRKRSDLATQRGRKRRSRRRDEFTRTERAPSNSSGTHYNIDRANDTDRSDDEVRADDRLGADQEDGPYRQASSSPEFRTITSMAF